MALVLPIPFAVAMAELPFLSLMAVTLGQALKVYYNTESQL